jgi:hypothetical protein
MSAGEDEDEDMIRIARERAAANDPQVNWLGSDPNLTLTLNPNPNT